MKQQSLASAFTHAFRGISTFFRGDRNGRIHLAVAVWTSVAGYYFEVSAMEWMILLLCFGLVISLEMLNHALENVCDTIHAAHHPLIKIAKDVSAAAVLWSAAITVVIGLIIFIPKIMQVL